MMGLNKAVAILAGLLLLAGYTVAASAAEASAEETAIRAITQAWLKAYNAGDAKAISALYAEQAVLLPPGAPAANGNAALRAYLAKDMAESGKAGQSGIEPPKRRHSSSLTFTPQCRANPR